MPAQKSAVNLFFAFNEYALERVTRNSTQVGLNSFDVKAGDCIECGKFEEIYPQSIEICKKLKNSESYPRLKDIKPART